MNIHVLKTFLAVFFAQRIAQLFK